MITLVIALHNHQPVGNFDWVIEDAYQRAYLPLMQVLEHYPSIHFAQHYTGILYDWFADNHPEFMDVIARACSSKRVELISGGYYEPILAMLPERDRVRQITKLNKRIRDTFRVEPTGMWLAERVYEPQFPSNLFDANIKYTFLDDTHFKCAGLSDEDLYGYYLTEDQGKPLAILPIDKRLRYTMPFAEPEETFKYLHSINRDDENRVVVFADDGEKFGVWPDTFKTVYERGWLQKFCEILVAESHWVRTVLPGDLVLSSPPIGRIYLPTASYAEMLRWALPTAATTQDNEDFEKKLVSLHVDDRYMKFVHGGFWRNFLAKYPDANFMHKKSLRVSNRLDGARAKHEGSELFERAEKHLMAGQCNCPYWHGVFGGLYLMNIRTAIYSEFIKAERVLDQLENRTTAQVSVVDFDMDGSEEIIVEGTSANMYVSPARGGSVFAFEHKAKACHLINVVERHEESYHRALAQQSSTKRKAKRDAPKSIHDEIKVTEPGLASALIFDTYRHGHFLDHFFDASQLTGELLRTNRLIDLGDFAQGAYEHHIDSSADDWTTVDLARSGVVSHETLSIQKRIAFQNSSADLAVRYHLKYLSGTQSGTVFGIEMAYTLSAGTAEDRYYTFDDTKPVGASALLNSVGEIVARKIVLHDEWMGMRVEIELERPALVLRAPIESVSLSERGMERIWQGSLLMLTWHLPDNGDWNIGLTQKVVEIG